jgi:hypothetical protein
MRFTEVDLFGIYVAPIAVIMLVAWLITIALRWVADRFGFLRYVWHPPLFLGAIYMIVLSTIVLTTAY